MPSIGCQGTGVLVGSERLNHQVLWHCSKMAGISRIYNILVIHNAV